MTGVVPIDVTTIDPAVMKTAIAQADECRDMAPVWELLAQPLAQAPRMHREHVLAIVLFQLSMDAADVGDHRGEETFLRAMWENCDRTAIDGAVRTGLLSVGGRQGWLDEAAYVELAARIEQLPEGHLARALFATIGRGQRFDDATPGHSAGSGERGGRAGS